MGASVHYVPVGLGTEHLVRPLVRGEWSCDRAVLLVPTHIGADARMVEATESILVETAGISAKITEVDTQDLATVVATSYDELLADLSDGHEVFLNVASPYWSLGAGFAIAAQYLIADSRHSDAALTPQGEPLEDRLTVYYTEPEGYRVEDLYTAAQQVREFRTSFDQMWDVATELKSDVESDKQTIGSLVELLEKQRDSSLNEIIDTLRAIGVTASDDDGIVQGFEHIITGIEEVTEGIDILARDDNRETIESLPFLGPMSAVTEGLAEVSDRPESASDEGTAADLLQYFAERLDHVHQVLQRVAYLHDDFETKFNDSTGGVATLLDEVDSMGIANGVQTYNGSHHAEVPGPLQFGLSDIQQAILYTLAIDGRADSIQGFTMRLMQQALILAEETEIQLTDHPAVDTLRTETADTPPQLRDALLDTFQSTVQYNLNSMEADGFINRARFGQTTAVDLSRAGSVYVATQSFNQEWQRQTFAELCEKVSAVIEDSISEEG